jgi:two-component system response regulator NreC
VEDILQRSARVLVCDDRTILREGLHALLEGDSRIELIASAQEADVVLIDLSLPNMDGLSAVREIKRRRAATKALVLTTDIDADSVQAALDAGADGLLPKPTSRQELLLAIEAVLNGRRYVSAMICHEPRSASGLGALSPREMQVLKRIAEGARNRDMATELGLSVKTVEKHRSNLMRKLNLRNTAALTGFAIENRVIRPSGWITE